MPIRKTNFYREGFYHVFNRGVEKLDIFLNDTDYEAFIGILKVYLSPEKSMQGRALRIKEHRLNEEVTLLVYCLMPNHFHFLVKQSTKDAVTKLMRRVLTAYSMYFNERYDRVGALFQGRFKAKDVDTDQYLLHLSRYIHRNPLELGEVKENGLKNYPWSSYPIYLGGEQRKFVESNLILSYFTKDRKEDYKQFVEYESDFNLPKDLLVED